MYLGDLSVVGQELGACGTNTDDDCDVVDNSTVDGAFRVTFPSVAPWLEPVAAGTCVADANTLCLNGGRFRVTVDFATSNGQTGSGTGVSLTSDSGYFWFFSAGQHRAGREGPERLLHLAPGRFWVFAGGLTNVHVVITVVDMQTGATKTYENPLGTAFVPLQDTNAFPCP